MFEIVQNPKIMHGADAKRPPWPIMALGLGPILGTQADKPHYGGVGREIFESNLAERPGGR